MLVVPQPHRLSAAQVGPLIAEDANTVAHVVWNGTALYDTKGNTWTQNGTVPQVARSGRTPPGAGPFSGTNYYSANVASLQFAGDYSVCVVYSWAATLHGVLAYEGANSTSGWAADVEGTPAAGSLWAIDNGTTQAISKTANGSVSTDLNCACWGRSGTNVLAKLNLGALVTTALGHAIVPGAAATNIGNTQAGNDTGWPASLYEILFSTTTPTDALFINIMNRVKSRLGITQW